MIPQRQRTCSTPGEAPHLHTWQLLWKRRFTTWSGLRSARFCFSLAGTLGRTNDEDEGADDDEGDDSAAALTDGDESGYDDTDEEADDDDDMDEDDEAAAPSRLDVNGVGRRTSGDEPLTAAEDEETKEAGDEAEAAEERANTESADRPAAGADELDSNIGQDEGRQALQREEASDDWAGRRERRVSDGHQSATRRQQTAERVTVTVIVIVIASDRLSSLAHSRHLRAGTNEQCRVLR